MFVTPYAAAVLQGVYFPCTADFKMLNLQNWSHSNFWLCFKTTKKLFQFIYILALGMCKYFRALGLNMQICEVQTLGVWILQQNRCDNSGNIIRVSAAVGILLSLGDW